MKYYKSERWLRKRYLSDRKTPEEIAKECGVSIQTIYRALHEFKIIRSKAPRNY